MPGASQAAVEITDDLHPEDELLLVLRLLLRTLQIGLPTNGLHDLRHPLFDSRSSDLGFRGRTGIYEVLMMSEEVRRLTIRNASGAEIKAAAVAQGLRTLRDDGAYKVLCGITTMDEVMRVTSEEA